MELPEAEKFCHSHTCAICGNPPVMFIMPAHKGTDGQIVPDGYEVRCQDKTHQGFIKEKSWKELYEAGVPVPIEIAQNLREREERRRRWQR